MLLEKFFEADYSAFGFSPVQQPPAQDEPIRLVKIRQEGDALDPSAFNMIIEVVGTGHHVGLRAVRAPEPVGLTYEYDNMRLVTATGAEISNPPVGVLGRLKEVVQACLDSHNRQTPTRAPRHG